MLMPILLDDLCAVALGAPLANAHLKPSAVVFHFQTTVSIYYGL